MASAMGCDANKNVQCRYRSRRILEAAQTAYRQIITRIFSGVVQRQASSSGSPQLGSGQFLKYSSDSCGLATWSVVGQSESTGFAENIVGMKNRHIDRHITVAVICFGLMMIATSLAQRPNTGQISGHVVDTEGATIKGASVFVRKYSPSEDNVRLVAHTDTHGDFVLLLPEGGYDVLVTSVGFASGMETIPILPGKTRKVQWKLRVLDCNFPSMNCDTFQ